MTDRDYKIEFETIVKEVITPIFRKFGFRKSGNNFYREINSIGQVFNVQQSQWNTKDNKSFTFNLGLINTTTYFKIYKRETPKFPKEYDCEISIRLGQLMKTNDKWYNLNKDTNFAMLKEQINTDLEKYAMQFFEEFSDINKWSDEYFNWD